jgi:5-deoxy-glucuronate isomerase
MEFALVRLAPGDEIDETSALETAWLLMEGRVRFAWASRTAEAARSSLFTEDPMVLHLPAGVHVRIEALDQTELARIRTPNDAVFPATLFDGTNMLESEDRDKGRWDDAAWRIVRTVFDTRNRPESRLVLGEVVNLPGRWSSYPPHHHPHPEIYHYRFTAPQGYGHGELGETVLKIRPLDTLLIVDGEDHSQVAAPGYGMYYLWVIRHMPGNPYIAPEFAKEHRWLKEPGAVTPTLGKK